METKKCSRCNQEQPISEFSKRNANSRHSVCKSCHNAYNKQHYQLNRSSHLERVKEHNKRYIKSNIQNLVEYKNNHPCIKCGETDYVALDLHHLDPNVKEYDVSRLVRNSVSWKKIEKELSKCVVLCANCHRKFHAGRFAL